MSAQGALQSMPNFVSLLGVLDGLIRDAATTKHPLAVSARELERLLAAIGASSTATEIHDAMLGEIDLMLRHAADRARAALRTAGWDEHDIANGYRIIDGAAACGHTNHE